LWAALHGFSLAKERSGLAREPVRFSGAQPVSTQTGASWGWRTIWLDILAFALWLSLAGALQWRTTDLVWSLWLSSLLVGYAMIVWSIFGPILRVVAAGMGHGAPVVQEVALSAVVLTGGLFMLMFFTVHFGGFHYGHSMFLNAFFPVTPGLDFPSKAAYFAIFRRYWLFVLLAALSERKGFRSWSGADSKSQGTAFKGAGTLGMAEPYKNVIRMHLLIFFFFFAKIVHLENAWVYIVVYAVYFFPWRILRKPKPGEAPA